MGTLAAPSKTRRRKSRRARKRSPTLVGGCEFTLDPVATQQQLMFVERKGLRAPAELESDSEPQSQSPKSKTKKTEEKGQKNKKKRKNKKRRKTLGQVRYAGGPSDTLVRSRRVRRHTVGEILHAPSMLDLCSRAD